MSSISAPPQPWRDLTALWQEFQVTHEDIQGALTSGDLKSAERALLRQRALIELLQKLIDETA